MNEFHSIVNNNKRKLNCTKNKNNQGLTLLNVHSLNSLLTQWNTFFELICNLPKLFNRRKCNGNWMTHWALWLAFTKSIYSTGVWDFVTYIAIKL